MRKTFIVVLAISFAVALFVRSNSARQSQAAGTNKQASTTQTSKPPAPKTSSTPPAKAATPSASALTTERQKESYAFGMNVARGLQQRMKEQSVDVDTAVMLRGIRDVLSGGKPLLTDGQADDALKQLQTAVLQKQGEQRKILEEKNMKEGEAFLAANGTKEGVVTLPSGLQYKIITQGTGPKPAATDTVVCQYRGTLVDGTEFDSSYKRGQPATFPLNGVIKGWTEGVQLMPVGSKYQFFIPSNLAYGERGYPGSPIGPNATLIFEIELVSIQGKQ
ncbi:MAG TPA: FKBP-type peptidyl-prolyl cis-trans isomerase [Verrucomicrobiae bacterium]|nr:FKBP-type peptidyl-prolyl cis-trans isomerase [Verrucomicrobiae bacterium]